VRCNAHFLVHNAAVCGTDCWCSQGSFSIGLYIVDFRPDASPSYFQRSRCSVSQLWHDDELNAANVWPISILRHDSSARGDRHVQYNCVLSADPNGSFSQCTRRCRQSYVYVHSTSWSVKDAAVSFMLPASLFDRLSVIMPPPVEKGTISVAFVRPSVCPSVAYIANNSRTQMPNLGGRLDATRTRVSRSQGQMSMSPGPLILRHIVRHIFRKARPTNCNLGIRMEDNDPHQPQAPWPPRSEVKVARSRD